MEAFLRLGVELPALAAPVADDSRYAAWREGALAAARSGVGTIWVAGGAGSTGGTAGGATCDACTLAGALSGLLTEPPEPPLQPPEPPLPPPLPPPEPPLPLVGVVAPVEGGRHPSVLARDVTGCDVLSGGRTALLLEAGRHATGAEALWAAAEAAAVCRTVFRDPYPAFEGRHFHVAGAVNRPAPVHPGGPPLLVALDGPPPAAQLGPSVPDPLASLLRAADAVVVTGSPDRVRRWARSCRAREPWRPIVWRGALGPEPEAAVAGLVALAGAGASGVVVRLVPADDQRGGPPPEGVGRLAAALVAAVAEVPWGPL